MRFRGKLQSWNEQRGFGFIRPLDGGEDVFVHVSALPTIRPGADDVLTFEISADRDGRKRAVQVRLQQVEAAGLVEDKERSGGRVQRPRETRERYVGTRGRGSLLQGVITLAIVAGIGWYAYQTSQRPAPRADPERTGARSESVVPSRCDSRTMCSQMTSCAEATYFLQNCPGTQMDGDGDGVPCEQQWCTSGR
jgi:cold shock CspA family protein